MDASSGNIEEVFTQALWDEFLLERDTTKYKTTEKLRKIKGEKREEIKAITATKATKLKMMGLTFPTKWRQKKFPPYQQTSC
eukprot:480972-Ditylum_brightwellii.AAC.1